MKTLFDLRMHSSIDLDRLLMGIESGIVEAHKVGLKEVEETLIAYRLIIQLSKRDAVERESTEWVDKVSVRNYKRVIMSTLTHSISLELKVKRENPPIPIRTMDYSCTFKEYDEGATMGHGETIQKAIESFLNSYESRHDLDRKEIKYTWS